MTFAVTVEYPIVSEVPGRVGNWTLEKVMQLGAPPTEGCDIELAPGWSSAPVKRTVLQHGGGILARLMACRTDSPEILNEFDQLVRDHGWRQNGGPWKGQSAVARTVDGHH